MILAIDLGSTSFKAAIFDRRLRQISVGSYRLAHRFGAGQKVEIDVDAVHAALRGALAQARAADHDIRVVALTSQAQTFTLVDAAGRSRMPFISWQDGRATSAAAELQKKLGNAFGVHSSFGRLLPALFIAKVRHVRPETWLMPLQLPSYVLRLWTGASVTDTNLAAMSGLYSLPLQGWWPAAVRACGLREQQLPRLIPVGEIAAETTTAARRFGLPRGIPVVLAGNDQTAGGYAARLETRDALLITIGTAQVAYTCCKRMPSPREGMIRGPYPGGIFYRMAADGCGGNIVNWAQTVLAGCADDDGFFKAAARAPRGCHGLVFDASLDQASGSWRNLGLHHTEADLTRSILENLGGRMAGMVRELGVNVKKTQALVAGGGSLRPLWRQIVSETLGARLVPTDGRPLRGAARMAAPHWRT
jgi:sugar (pentulose or hexulose) kinase